MQLTAGEELLDLVLNAPMGICILNAKTLISETLNDAFLEVAGKSYEQIYGHYYWDSFAEVRHLFEDDLARAAKGETIRGEELEIPLIRYGKMEMIVINFVYAPLKNKAGEISKVAVWVLENTNQVKQRQQIQLLNEELSATNEELASTNEEITSINEELQQSQSSLQDLNDELENMVSIRTQALAESEANTQALNEELTAINEEMFNANEELLSANDELSMSKKELQSIVQQLAASEFKTRSIIEQSPFPIGVFVGDDMRIEFANQAILDVWGKGNNVIGKRYAEILPELDSQEIFSQLEQVYTSGDSFHARNQRVEVFIDGVMRVFYFNYSFTALKDESGNTYGVINTAADVTDVVTAKHTIEESEERFRTMAEDTDILIALADQNSNATFFNKAWQNMTGKSMDRLLQYGWAELIHPDDKEKFIDAYKTAFKNQVSLSGEFRILTKDGDYRWLYARIPARFSSGGSFIGYISSCTDITELKEDELRKSDFISMVSHELKTPLTSLTGLVQMTAMKLKNSEDSQLKFLMEKAGVQVKRMATMINGFLNMSRLESGKILIDKHYFNLDELVREIITETKLTISRPQIHFEPSDSLTVYADQDKIGSVISNLLSNAIKYSPKEKTIVVTCHVEGNMAQVSVRDEGLGLKQEDTEKIFDRYYRVEANHTKNISGFGIGLYLSAEITKGHSGKIWVESELGVGSTFYFSIPI